MSNFLKIIILFFFTACVSLEQKENAKVLLSGDNYIIYSYPASFPLFKSKLQTFNERQRQILTDFIKNLYRTQQKMIGDNREKLFNLTELSLISNALNTEEDNLYFYHFIFLREDKLNPYKRFFRTSVWIFYSENKWNLVLEDIYKNYIYDDLFKFKDWALPEEKKIYCSGEELIFYEDKWKDSFHYSQNTSCELRESFSSLFKEQKKLEINYSWLILFQAPSINRQEEKKTETNSSQKLKELKELLDKKLITKEEYEEYKRKILDSLLQ